MSGRTLGIIPARAGSRRLLGKNMCLLGGRPLIDWTLSAAAASKLDALALSSDDPAVLDRAAGWPRLRALTRPAALAGDEVRNVEVMRQVLSALAEPFEFAVLLQPTSPFRTAADIDEAVARCRETGADACLSVCSPGKPARWLLRPEGERMHPLLAADPGPVYLPNGAVYVIRVERLLAGADFHSTPPCFIIMPRARSVDIDDADDLALAESFHSIAMRGN
jgi:N-acylneuraminate cytidylyltransferase